MRKAESDFKVSCYFYVSSVFVQNFITINKRILTWISQSTESSVCRFPHFTCPLPPSSGTVSWVRRRFPRSPLPISGFQTIPKNRPYCSKLLHRRDTFCGWRSTARCRVCKSCERRAAGCLSLIPCKWCILLSLLEPWCQNRARFDLPDPSGWKLWCRGGGRGSSRLWSVRACGSGTFWRRPKILLSSVNCIFQLFLYSCSL